MTTCKIIWTIVVLAGLAANVRTLGTALAKRRRLRQAGLNGELRLIVLQAIRGEATTLLVQCLLVGVTAAAWRYPEPIRPAVRHYFLVCGWACAACSLLLGIDSLLDLHDRRRLFRRMTAPATEGKAQVSQPE